MPYQTHNNIILYQPLRKQNQRRFSKNHQNLNGISCISTSKNGERPYQHTKNQKFRSLFLLIYHNIFQSI